LAYTQEKTIVEGWWQYIFHKIYTKTNHTSIQ